MDAAAPDPVYDLVIIGGGINGCGIARDASGRGLKVLLCEKDDLAQATSSASTKLFHGGLRYLEYFEFRLVREALKEREVLLRAMPHISWPLRFVLPHHSGLRPRWLLRLGLFVYDHLGGRKILPPTRTLDLRRDPAGVPLQDRFATAFEYSDCWVEDSRLVALNARDAADKGAEIRTRTACQSAERRDGVWHVTLLDSTKTPHVVRARGLVNAGGPWVEDIFRSKLRQNSPDKTRLVRGSHIVTRKLFEHERPYFFQQSDGRIIFAIPYETDFTLIGTTDLDHTGDPGSAACSDEEREYLCRAASEYFKRPVTTSDVVWTYSGVRPLYDDGASSATAATRDYVLKIETVDGTAPLLNVFGGKITTYRKLAEAALTKLLPFFPKLGASWTAGAPLPGGDFPVPGVPDLIASLRKSYAFLDEKWSKRLIRAYGTLAFALLGDARTSADLGQNFGWNLTEREAEWLCTQEFATSAADILWRRSKLGLRLNPDDVQRLENWFARRDPKADSAANRFQITNNLII